uniref:Hypoxia up-regulated protein 1 n=1 Tax=Hemiscolopendra marginata TaxID=943146 RepID=A0A646QJH2_9MYRI
MKSIYSILNIVASAFIIALWPQADAIAVMSVDFGSQWMKIAIVSPGVPMEIVLNKESKRKTPVAISFRNSEREIGDSALTQGVRFPLTTYTHLLDLLGKEVNNSMVELYKKRFPHHEISADPETGTVLFRKDENSTFSVEELLSMILHRAKELAQDFADQAIKDMVVTVPAFFNQAERRAILRAAELSNIKILQLINDNTAVALNYGVFRRKVFNSTIQYIMFYDMGASSTKATIVGYQVVKTKEKGYAESNPQLSILGMGFDRTLGGLEFTLRLRNHLAKVFNEQKKTTTDVFKSPRALAKLLKESERVKMILSANTEHIAQVENLIDEQDFKSQVHRADFEEMCSDLFDRVSFPINQALKQAAMTMDAIDQVILVGAGTRVPKIQEKLLEAVGKNELGKNLNTDEAAALGAVYQAAHLSQGFKVKKFLIKDAVQYPIQVDFEREYETEENRGTKIVTRTLFGFLNPYPLKKVLTFNRLTKNEFQFNVNYGEINLPAHDLKIFRSMNISKVHLSGIQDALTKHSNDGSEPKGIKAHFRMDESGILSLDQVESVFELKEEESEADGEFESAFSKLGSTISKFFTGGTGEESEKEGQTLDQDSTDQKMEEKSDSINATNATSEESQQPLNQTEEQKNTTLSNETEAANQTKKESKKSKIVTVKEPISVTQERVDVVEPSPEKVQSITKRIELFNTEERLRKEKEEAKNNLEAFILDTQDKLYQPEYETASTEDEREKIRSEMSAISDWLYEEGEESDVDVYRGKLKELQSLSKELFIRVKEHKDRPEVLKSLHNLLNVSEIFLQRARTLPEEEQYYTQVELDTLEKAINDTKQWKIEKESLQEKQSLTEMPKLTVRSIAEKISVLDREVKYLLNKARTFKPVPKKDKNETVNKNDTEQVPQENVDENTTEKSPSDTDELRTSENEVNSQETQQENSKDESTPVPDPSKPEDGHTEL